MHPAEVPKRIVFHLNEHYAFKTEFYEPQMTNDKISLEEINQFMPEINAECKLYERSQAAEEPKSDELSGCTKFALLVIFFLIFMPSKDFYRFPFTKGETIILILFFGYFADKVYFSLRDCFSSKPKPYPWSQLIETCQDKIDKQNEIMRGRGLKWHLPAAFPDLIELTEDMEKKNHHLIPTRFDLPQTTQNRIIFPLQHLQKSGKIFDNIWRFSQDSFSPDMADGRISCQEVQKFLSEINSRLKTPPKESSRISYIAFLCLCLEFFGLLYVSNHFPDLLTTFQIIIIAIILILASACFAGAVALKEVLGRFVDSNTKCQRVINRHNLILQSRGLKWQFADTRLPYFLYFPDWIELCKISSNQDPNSQPIDILPENQEPPANPEGDIEAGNQNVEQNTHKKFKNDAYVPLHEEENENSNS